MHGTFRPNHMTAAEYEAERAKLRETYGDNRQEAGARFEQELARLFYRSGWTQEELAARESTLLGKKVDRSYIARRLLFGRFLDFVPSGHNLPTALTERRFRDYWERTDKDEGNERIRFGEVVKLLDQSGPHSPPKKPVGKKLRDAFADGKWHRLDELAKHLDTDESHVLSAIKTAELHGHVRADKKRVGKDSAGSGPTTAFRMFRTNRTVSFEELTTKLAPIVEGLEAEGRKNMATMSPATVATLAGRLKQLIDDWGK